MFHRFLYVYQRLTPRILRSGESWPQPWDAAGRHVQIQMLNEEHTCILPAVDPMSPKSHLAARHVHQTNMNIHMGETYSHIFTKFPHILLIYKKYQHTINR